MKANPVSLHTLLLGISLTFITLFNACTTPKNVVYFQNMRNDAEIQRVVDNNFELRIRKNDVLGINIISPDPVTTPLFNGAQGTSSGEGGTNAAGGYVVDSN